MPTTAEGAFGVIKTRLTANQPTWNGGAVTLYWPNEQNILPDTPVPFVYLEFEADRGELASVGGGRGNNRYRHNSSLTAYIFVPMGMGAPAAMNIAEQVAGVFRSYRDDYISCFTATVFPGGEGTSLKPAGLRSAVDNYWWSLAVVDLFYDLIG